MSPYLFDVANFFVPHRRLRQNASQSKPTAVPMSQRIWTAPRFGPPGPNPLADMDPPTKLSENIILNVLLKMDDTLRFSAY